MVHLLYRHHTPQQKQQQQRRRYQYRRPRHYVSTIDCDYLITEQFRF